MIFKNLFFSLQIEDLKKRLGSIFLTILAFFICLPIYCMLQLSSNTDPDKYFYISEEFREIFILSRNANNISFGNFGLTFIACACAIILAVTGFSYLQSKKKVDFYHSIPVRREVHFFIRYVNGILIFIVPYFISLLLTCLIFQIRGYMDILTFQSAMAAFFLNLMYFLLVYSVSVIAVMLTGNIIVSIIASGVLCGIAPLIYAVILTLHNFFDTYIRFNNAIMDIFIKTRFLSPISMILYHVDEYGSINTYGDQSYQYSIPPVSEYIAMAALILIISLAALLLYRKRRLEKAGSAIVFRAVQPVVKFLVVIPGALLCGIFFSEFNKSVGFYIFGILLGVLILCGVFEIIYHFDVKKGFAHKSELGIIALACLLIGLAFRSDWFGYDTYLPKKEEIKSIGLSIDIGGHYYSDEIEEGADGTSYLTYLNKTEYQLKHVNLTNIEIAYPLIEDAVAKNEFKEYDDGLSVAVKYILNNGKTVYRNYTISRKANEERINKILTDKNYYEDAYSIYQISDELVSEIEYSLPNVGRQEKLSLTTEECKELYQIYKKEFEALTLYTLRDNYVKGELHFLVSLDRERQITYPICGSFVRTIAYLAERGYSVETEYYLSEIESVSIQMYPNGNEEATDYYINSGKALEYTDKSKIEELLPYLEVNWYGWYYNLDYMSVEADVIIRYKTGKVSNGSLERYYYIKEIPEFIKEDLNKH